MDRIYKIRDDRIPAFAGMTGGVSRNDGQVGCEDDGVSGIDIRAWAVEHWEAPATGSRLPRCARNDKAIHESP